MRYYYKSRLKEMVYRKFGNLTHEEISERAGVNRPTVTRWMGDRLFRQVRMEFVEPLARWLDCNPADLYEIVEVNEEDAGENTAALPVAS